LRATIAQLKGNTAIAIAPFVVIEDCLDELLSPGVLIRLLA
jgi:hypothetical protein